MRTGASCARKPMMTVLPRGGRCACGSVPCCCEEIHGVNSASVLSWPVLWPSVVDGRLARPPARGPRESARKELSNVLLPTSDRCGDGRHHHASICSSSDVRKPHARWSSQVCSLQHLLAHLAHRVHVTHPCTRRAAGSLCLVSATRSCHGTSSLTSSEHLRRRLHGLGASACFWSVFFARLTGAA
jgi:hypothetical protein